MNWLRGGCLLFALLVCLPAWSEPLVIYGPGSQSSDLAAQALREVEAQYGVTIAADRLVHVNEVPFPASLPLWMMGDAEVIPCRGASITADELRDLLARAQAAEGAMEWDEADKLLDDATAALSCSGEMIDVDLLWRLFFVHGAIEYFDGRTNEAQDYFRMALGIDPGRRFDPNFPPQIQAAYLNAREELQLSDTAHFRFVGAREGTTEIFLDGAPLPIDPGEVCDVQSGYHLLQYRTRLDVFYSVPFMVEPKLEALLVSGTGYSWAILAGDSDDKAKVIATQALTAAPGVGDSLVYVVSVAEDTSVYRFTPQTGAFERPSGSTVAATDPDTDQTTDGSTGDGTSVPDTSDPTGDTEDPTTTTDPGDTVTAPAQTPERKLGIEVGVGPLIHFSGGARAWVGPSLVVAGRLAQGLYLDGGFHLGFRSRDGNTNVFPAGRIGIRAVFTSTVARPYAGGLFAIGGGNADTGPKPGGILVGGVLIEPGSANRFRLAVEVGGGYVGGGLLLINVRVGPLL